MRVYPNLTNAKVLPAKRNTANNATKRRILLIRALALAAFLSGLYLTAYSSLRQWQLYNANLELASELGLAKQENADRIAEWESTCLQLAELAIGYADEFLILDLNAKREAFESLGDLPQFPDAAKASLEEKLKALGNVELLPQRLGFKVLNRSVGSTYAAIELAPTMPLSDFTRSQLRITQAGRTLHQATLFPLVGKLYGGRNVAVLIDRSASTKNVIADCKAESKKFVSDLVHHSSVKIFSFNENLASLTTWTKAQAEVERAIDSIQPDGGTALRDSLAKVVEELRSLQGESSIVLISDGRDSDAAANFDQIIKHAKGCGIRLHTVGVNTAEDHTTLLKQLAHETNGSTVRVGHMAELSDFFDSVDRALKITNYRLVILDPIDPAAPITITANNGFELEVALQ